VAHPVSQIIPAEKVNTSTRESGPRGVNKLMISILRRLLPILLIACVLGVLEAILMLAGVPSYIMPRPSLIALTAIQNAALLTRHAGVTILEALLGFIVGNLVGVLLAVSFVYSRTLERTLFPLAQTIRSIPVVALAPLFLIWFGNGLTPKVVTAALICFFPTLVNTFRGLVSVDRSALELMHTLAASRAQIFWIVRWPAALPYLFAALKIASASAVIGALIAEWIGSDTGLGFLVVTSTYEYKVELLWATILVTSLIAVVWFELVNLVEAKVIPWHDPRIDRQ
jgi:NitT/TauT family transport system permease protein